MSIFIFTLVNIMKKINKTEDRKLLKVAIQVSIHLRYICQDKGLQGKELLKRYPQYSKVTIYRHPTKPVQVPPQAKAPQRRGRPSKLTNREKQQIPVEIKKTSCDSWIICNKTVTRSSRGSNWFVR